MKVIKVLILWNNLNSNKKCVFCSKILAVNKILIRSYKIMKVMKAIVLDDKSFKAKTPTYFKIDRCEWN